MSNINNMPIIRLSVLLSCLLLLLGSSGLPLPPAFVRAVDPSTMMRGAELDPRGGGGGGGGGGHSSTTPTPTNLNPYQNVFPFFDNTNALDRNDLLLKALRQRHSLFINDDIVPKAITNSRDGLLRLKDGPTRQFYWHIISEDPLGGGDRSKAAAAR
jgi:hypothetical protein